MVKRRGAGRPRAAYESVRKEITLNENQLSKIEAAARIKGKDFSKLVRDVAIAAAHRDDAGRQILRRPAGGRIEHRG